MSVERLLQALLHICATEHNDKARVSSSSSSGSSGSSSDYDISGCGCSDYDISGVNNLMALIAFVYY